MIQQLLNKKSIFFILLLILTLPSVFALLKPGYYNMHDDMQMVRQLQLEKCIKDGQIPCRWSPDLGYAYGYPLFNFYPPLPYIIGQIFRNLGISFMWSVKLTAIFHFLLSAFFAFLLSSYLFGNIAGLISSLFYTYAPYHALNVYVRGAMNEAWAYTFFPAIFYTSKKLIDVKKSQKIKYTLLLSFSILGLILSHNPMLLVFAPFTILWVVLCLFQKHKNLKKIFKQKTTVLKLFYSNLLALSLAAFYTLPVLFETKLVQIASMFKGYYSYIVHFTSLRQLFISSFWGDGASVWGQEDQMSFMIGYLHWILPTLILFVSIIAYSSKIQTKLKASKDLFIFFLFFFFSALFTAFMTHERSIFIWKIFAPIQKIQFPWRFLNLSVFFFSISIGFAFQTLNHIFKSYQKPVKNIFALPLTIPSNFRNVILSLFQNPIIPTTIITISLLLFLNLKYFYPIKSGPLTDDQKFSGLAWQNQMTSGIYDYLPNTAYTAAKSQAKFVIDEIEPKTTSTIYGQKKGTDWLFFNADLKEKTTITLAQMYFPNFKAYDYDVEIPVEIEPELGRMVLKLNPGQHQIYIKLKNTPIRTISNIISLISWTSLLFYFLKKCSQLPIFNK